MKVYRAYSDTGWTFIMAASSVEEAYEMAASSDKGYVDIDSVFTIDFVFTKQEHSMILDEF